jgi:iron complex transport system permease protein
MRNSNSYRKTKIAAGFLLLLLISAVALLYGSVRLGPLELFQQRYRAILYLRILRVITAIIAGAGLATCGVALQAVLRNVLAEPYLLGTSSAAGLAAVGAVVLGLPAALTPVVSFCGALLSVFIVYRLARKDFRFDIQAMLLSGVIISILSSAVMVFIISFSANEALHGMLWWLWGSLQNYDLKLLLAVGLITLGGCAYIFFLAQDLNGLSLGEEGAIHLGIDAEKVKKEVFLVTSLITASLVSLCGIIGFVGLIVPHAVRLLIGPNHKTLIPAVWILAAAFLVACDLLSRTLFVPFEVPLGVISAFIGAPLFILLLRRKDKAI